MMDFYSIKIFLQYLFKGLPHEQQMDAVQNHPNLNVIEIIKDFTDATGPVSTDYINGIYFGLCIASASQEKTFKEFVRKLHDDDDEWQIKELKDLKL